MDTFNSNQIPPVPDSRERKTLGPLIAVIVILALIIVGSLYFLNSMPSQELPIPPITETGDEDKITSSLNQQSTSDDLNSIEADLEATDLDSLDQGISDLEAELQ